MDKKRFTKKLNYDNDTLFSNINEIDVSYKKALTILKKKLPINWANTIAKQTGKKPITVYKVLDGSIRENDNSILIKAIELAKAHAERKIETINKIRSI